MHPEQAFRVGLVSASIFRNDVEGSSGTRERRTVALERRYKDAEGEWQSTSTFSLAELPQAMAVLKLAEDYVSACEADVTPSHGTQQAATS